MNAFNLGDYVDVPTRLAEALKRWPNYAYKKHGQ
jgi:hypothetical protein